MKNEVSNNVHEEIIKLKQQIEDADFHYKSAVEFKTDSKILIQLREQIMLMKKRLEILTKQLNN